MVCVGMGPDWMNQQKIVIKIPQSVRSDYKGYYSLLSNFRWYLDCDASEITLNFRANTWFDANLLPIVYAYIRHGKKSGIGSVYDNQRDCPLHRLLLRNNFAKECFDLPYQPRREETVVPFKIFRAEATYQFADYIDAQLIRYFPAMEDRVKRDLSTYIQEVFGNAQIHGGCKRVYTCGQYYHKQQKMDFTIVNLGTTIGENVTVFLGEQRIPLPSHNISWAVEPEHSTKRTHSGGIGLSLMRDFIHFNHGKYQIVSGKEYWELNGQRIQERTLPAPFPGTIVNIEINQNDKSYYQYGDTDDDPVF